MGNPTVSPSEETVRLSLAEWCARRESTSDLGFRSPPINERALAHGSSSVSVVGNVPPQVSVVDFFFLDDGHGNNDPRHLIVEINGCRRNLYGDERFI
jgi:hypothetical protein